MDRLIDYFAVVGYDFEAEGIECEGIDLILVLLILLLYPFQVSVQVYASVDI